MKCLVCPSEIDELKEFPPTIGPGGVQIEDTLGKWKHSQTVGAWTHVTLTAQISAGTVTILSGHVCPAHPVTPDSIVIIAARPPIGPSEDLRPEKKTSETTSKRTS